MTGHGDVVRTFTIRPPHHADTCGECGADATIPPRCEPCDAELGGE